MRFDGLDLNLLVTLDALIETGSVSTAADRLHLSQSAMSGALKRLRDYFDDELLINRGRRMVLTPRGAALAGPVHAALLQIRAAITTPAEFDPATSRREFRISASDYVVTLLLAPALDRIAAKAPHLRFDLRALDDAPWEAIEKATSDLLITVEPYVAAGHPTRILFEDDYVVVAWSGNRLVGEAMTVERFMSLGHVIVSFGRARQLTFCDHFLTNEIGPRRVEITAASFLAVPGFLLGTQRIATMHRRLAAMLSRWYPLKIVEHPLPIPGVREVAQWNLLNDTDRGLRWLAGFLAECCAPVAGRSEPCPGRGRLAAGQEFERAAGIQADEGGRAERDIRDDGDGAAVPPPLAEGGGHGAHRKRDVLAAMGAQI